MKRIRKVAEDFAKRMGINTLPLEFETLYSIAEANNWKIVTYSKGYDFIRKEELEKYYYTSKGFTYASPNFTIIFIRDDLAYLDKIDVICHEIGHLVLRHIEVGSNQKSNKHCDNIQEQEADIFALQLQAPDYLMQSMNIDSVYQLTKKGIFSKENAHLRYKLYKQDFLLVNIMDKLLVIGSITLLSLLILFLIQGISHYIEINRHTYTATEQITSTPVPPAEATEQTTDQAPGTTCPAAVT